MSAIAGAPRFLAAADGIGAAKSNDGGRGSAPLGYVPLNSLALAVDELERGIAGLPGTADEWVAAETGASQAVLFARALRTAVQQLPVREEAHHVRRVRCPKCEQLTLVWHPTPFIGGDVTIACRDPKCGHHLDQEEFEDLAGTTGLTGRIAS